MLRVPLRFSLPNKDLLLVKVTDSEELTVGGQGDTFPNQETAICI
jgi:hypothetical protein